MSQSKTFCPLCDRAPGGVHISECPRSRARLAALALNLSKAPRLVWKKGLIAFKKPRKWVTGFDVAYTNNPGVPYVVKGTNPRAGGVPRGKKKEAGVFLRDLGLEKAP